MTIVKSQSYFGIVHRTPENLISDDHIQLVANCSKAEHLGRTRSFPLKFAEKAHPEQASRKNLLVGYECLPISEFKLLHVQSYNCQQHCHAAKLCKNPLKCAKWSGDQLVRSSVIAYMASEQPAFK